MPSKNKQRRVSGRSGLSQRSSTHRARPKALRQERKMAPARDLEPPIRMVLRIDLSPFVAPIMATRAPVVDSQTIAITAKAPPIQHVPYILDQLFREHAARWKTETQHWSSVRRMLAHPSYLRIVGLAKLSRGTDIERLLLQELQSEPDNWFAALAAVTGEDPVRPKHDFDGAVDAWLEWGRQKGII
jgi:hypothetical protein